MMAFAAAAVDCTESLPERRDLVARNAQSLLDHLCTDESRITPTVPLDLVGWDGRLSGVINILVEGVDSETLVLECDQAGFEVSAASACSSGSLDASHVLLAMGVPRDQALCSLRISFDERVDITDLHRLAEALMGIAERRRRR